MITTTLNKIREHQCDMTDIILTLTIPGEPVPKGRPRARVVTHNDTRKKPFVQIYPDAKTTNFETHIKLLARQAMGFREPHAGPCELEIWIYLPIPKSWTKMKREAAEKGELAHTKKPDAGNVQKAVEDALNEVAYLDDSQITDVIVHKRFAVGLPHTNLQLRAINLPSC